ncbi:MAG: hypothetical protein A2504_14225 [Bdellovibrionales bacterium RIFOXYD12_FULL_39_22]|nr:MAG: hypothetical protein A2385_04660 [Bdellovibrionales bacterium RIFOXYB1_FULL_39_21]OFZ43439.1 MAG: hypothetical protein A2485_13175 [Bdellovibrionales bacterium RIFOXYC12_FULL_39_17]OFZ46982.1 MAG: hypothetical protein A2404_00235 [Bdellovibrionales bacterium RIFOXYC1_FULL_39_130]OFZ72957.1 MAG: hypothetical protein A2451_07305 [Bdellovibrionales bacterium RIFOXYC2_FULL_39_8]OFZ76179.1 MAG: hypothetical protein A2560_07485 [Bdellovibrionales bacterium RIFOXYD1_FULL_39_84]OFZ94414.1 MAG:
MLARKNFEASPTPLSEEWVAEFEKSLHHIYKNELDKNSRTIEVFGDAYHDEIVVAISLISPSSPNSAPVSFILSLDLDKKENATKLLKNILDITGVFLDQYFNSHEWDDYSPTWTEATYKKTLFYYQVTRENIRLSKMADGLLSNN